MRIPLLLAFVFFSAISASAQSGAVPQFTRSYSLLRENEDWSFLADPALREDIWDPAKYIPLRRRGWYVTIGGEIREVFEHVANDNWGKQPYRNAFFLQRYMLHTDWHIGNHFQAFMQVKSGLVSFRQGGPRPIDEKKLDFEAACVEVGASSGRNRIVASRGPAGAQLRFRAACVGPRRA
jgi:hypothetical protein